MRKTILLILITLFSNLIYSQESETDSKKVVPTTIEEYNYMTKGFKIQQSSGLDMKKGYSFENIASIQRNSYTFTFKALIRTDEKQLAGVLIIGNSKVSGKNYYLGLPIGNPTLQSEFEKDVKYWDESMTTAFAQSLSEIYSKILDTYYLQADKVKD